MNPEIETLRQLLKELADLAEHSSLTGSLSQGASRAVQRYNAVLDRLVALGAIPEGLFTPLDASTDYDGLGVEARLLASTLKNEKGAKFKDKGRREGHEPDASVIVRLAPFVDSADLTRLVREYRQRNAFFDENLITSLAPFLDRKMLGEIIRDHFMEGEEPEPPAPPEAPRAPEPPEAPNRDLATTGRHTLTVTEERRPETLVSLADRLRDPNLSNEERQSIALQLAQIAHIEASEGGY